ncbi:hypothetical protein FACS189443_5670 [Planctomycetales bacterium]|nr:hypothetical protein FACS189443_5670 [Planctomycetales bacterium]
MEIVFRVYGPHSFNLRLTNMNADMVSLRSANNLSGYNYTSTLRGLSDYSRENYGHPASWNPADYTFTLTTRSMPGISISSSASTGYDNVSGDSVEILSIGEIPLKGTVSFHNWGHVFANSHVRRGTTVIRCPFPKIWGQGNEQNYFVIYSV